MKTLIVYCSMYGTTQKAAHLLSQGLEGEVLVVNLKSDKILFNLADFDSVIIGGSIHIGEIQVTITNFMKENREILLTKNLGLFLCCWHDGFVALDQFVKAFPKEFREKSIGNGIFGGEFPISKMGFIEKQMAEYIAGVTTDTSNLDLTSIMSFTKKLNSAFAPV
jgi:menaquinone-dependent protoporphyrinogen oxidase